MLEGLVPLSKNTCEPAHQPKPMSATTLISPPMLVTTSCLSRQKNEHVDHMDLRDANLNN